MADSLKYVEIRWRKKLADGAWEYRTQQSFPAPFYIPSIDRGWAYVVQARNVCNDGSVSEWVEAEISADGQPVPLPIPLTVIGQQLTDGIEVSWSMAGNLPAGAQFEVQRATDSAGAPGTWAQVALTTSYQVTDVVKDTALYWYRVRTFDSFGNSSEWATTTTSTQGTPVPDPTTETPGAVLNPFFEAGDQLWTKGASWTIIQSANALTGAWCANKATGTAQSDLANTALTPVEPGQAVTARIYARSGGTANGTITVGIRWLTSAQVNINADPDFTTTRAAATLTSYGVVTLKSIAPATAAFCRLVVRVAGHTAGWWAVDNAFMYLYEPSSLSAADRQALDYIEGAGADNVLLPAEKKNILVTYRQMRQERSFLLAEAGYSYGTPPSTTAYIAAINSLRDYMQSLGLFLETALDSNALNTIGNNPSYPGSNENAWVITTTTGITGSALRAAFAAATAEAVALRQAITNAEVQARAAINTVVNQVASDGYLTRAERFQAQNLYESLVATGGALLTQASLVTTPPSIDTTVYSVPLLDLVTFLRSVFGTSAPLIFPVPFDGFTTLTPTQITNWTTNWKNFSAGVDKLHANLTAHAQGDATSALAKLVSLASDTILTSSEKIIAYQLYNTLVKEGEAVKARAAALPTPIGPLATASFDTPMTALTTYLNAIVPVNTWNRADLPDCTGIVPADWKTAWENAYNGLATLQNEILNAVLNYLIQIAADGIVSPGEKKALMIDYQDLVNGGNDCAARMGAATPAVVLTAPNDKATLFDAPLAALLAYLNGLDGAVGTNKVWNASFDTDTNGNGYADGFGDYSNGGGAKTASIVATGGVDGGKYQRITWTVAAGTERGIYLANDGVVNTNLFQPNKTYVWSWWAKAAGNAIGMPLRLAWNTAPTVQTWLSNPNLTTAWQRYSARVTFGATADINGFITVQTGSTTNATVEFDQMQVEEVTSATAIATGYQGPHPVWNDPNTGSLVIPDTTVWRTTWNNAFNGLTALQNAITSHAQSAIDAIANDGVISPAEFTYVCDLALEIQQDYRDFSNTYYAGKLTSAQTTAYGQAWFEITTTITAAIGFNCNWVLNAANGSNDPTSLNTWKDSLPRNIVRDGTAPTTGTIGDWWRAHVNAYRAAANLMKSQPIDNGYDDGKLTPAEKDAFIRSVSLIMQDWTYIDANMAYLNYTARTAYLGTRNTFTAALSGLAGLNYLWISGNTDTDHANLTAWLSGITIIGTGSDADVTNLRKAFINMNTWISNVKTLIPAPGSTLLAGLAAPGGTTTFLRADGAWAAPPGGGGGSVTNVSGSGGVSVANGTTTPSISLVYGIAAGTVCQGNDSRLSNARPGSYVQSPDGDRNAATKLPTTTPQGVRFDFATAGSVGTAGNYAGVMTYAPWDGTTGSTGDASYQLAFGGSGLNGAGIPRLRLRKGIDSTWNAWYDILTTANVNDGTIGNDLRLSGISPTIYLVDTDTGATRYVHHNGGLIGFLHSGANWVFRCSDTMCYGPDFTSESDARIKGNVVTIESALAKILAMRGVYYTLNSDPGKHRQTGVIAQEIQKILPEVVTEDDKGMLSVSYGKITGVLIEAIKEQDAKILQLIALVERKNTSWLSRLTSMLKRLGSKFRLRMFGS